MTKNEKKHRKNQSSAFKHRSNESLPYHAESKQLKAEVENLAGYSSTERK